MDKREFRDYYKEYSNRVIKTKVILSVASNADNIIAAAFISSVVLASLALIMPLVIFIIALSVMFSAGLGSYIGFYLGRDNINKANDLASFIIIVISIISLIIGMITSINASSIASILGASGKYHTAATIYLRILGISFIPQIISTVLDKLIMNDGSPKFTYQVNIITMIINLSFNLLLVIAFSMGVKGLALATLLSQLFHLGVNIYYFIKKSKFIRFIIPSYHFHELKRILYNGSSDFLSVFTDAIMIYVVNKAILNFLPNEYLEAFASATIFTALITKIYVGSQVGLQPILSRFLGKGYFNKLKNIFVYSLKRSVVYAVILYIILIPVSFILLPYLLDNKDLVFIAFRIYLGVGIAYISSCVGVQIILFFTAINRPIESLAIAFIRTIILIPLSSISMIYLIGVDGIAIGFLLPEILISGVFIYYYKKADFMKYKIEYDR
ncbi:MATE family efflux transporter [Vallitalea guaymasensis]|uniref:MATE family efflux transporter n=1 Tax=Vallitalea guaymasensis TaxID=1185412 RepID=UPI002353A0BD|nr:MATE family efflux transporter [Vallitalea guaymasensis]